MAAPVVETFTSQVYQNDVAWELTKPTGLANNDVLLAILYFEDLNALPISYPTGFTEQESTSGLNGVNQGIAFATKPISNAAGEPASYTFTRGGSAQGHVGILLRISGADNTTPKDATAVFGNGNSAAPTNAGVTTVTADTLLIDVFMSYNINTGPAAPTGFTLIVNADREIEVAYRKAQASTGATGAITNGTPTSSQWVTGLIAIRPAAVGDGVITLKPLAGTLAPSGTIAKAATKALAGTLTTSGAYTGVRVRLISLAGTLTTSGAFSKQANKALNGALAPTGIVTKAVSKGLAGTLTLSGGIAKLVGKALSGTLALGGNLTKLVSKALSSILTLAGGYSGTTGATSPMTPSVIALTGSYEPSTTLSGSYNVATALTGSYEPSTTLSGRV